MLVLTVLSYIFVFMVLLAGIIGSGYVIYIIIENIKDDIDFSRFIKKEIDKKYDEKV